MKRTYLLLVQIAIAQQTISTNAVINEGWFGRVLEVYKSL